MTLLIGIEFDAVKYQIQWQLCAQAEAAQQEQVARNKRILYRDK